MQGNDVANALAPHNAAMYATVTTPHMVHTPPRKVNHPRWRLPVRVPAAARALLLLAAVYVLLDATDQLTYCREDVATTRQVATLCGTGGSLALTAPPGAPHARRKVLNPHGAAVVSASQGGWPVAPPVQPGEWLWCQSEARTQALGGVDLTVSPSDQRWDQYCQVAPAAPAPAPAVDARQSRSRWFGGGSSSGSVARVALQCEDGTAVRLPMECCERYTSGDTTVFDAGEGLHYASWGDMSTMHVGMRRLAQLHPRGGRPVLALACYHDDKAPGDGTVPTRMASQPHVIASLPPFFQNGRPKSRCEMCFACHAPKCQRRWVHSSSRTQPKEVTPLLPACLMLQATSPLYGPGRTFRTLPRALSLQLDNKLSLATSAIQHGGAVQRAFLESFLDVPHALAAHPDRGTAFIVKDPGEANGQLRTH